MFTSKRIGMKPLAQFCHDVGISLEAGIDLRKALARESERGNFTKQRWMAQVRQRIEDGGTLAEGMIETVGYFPRLVCEMVALGEATGKLDAVLLRLADHYNGQLRLRRVFLAGIAWPMIQLAAAVFVIGLLIWILGFIGNTDVLGFGLTGTAGLIKYVVFVATVAAIIAVFVRGAMRGSLWRRPVQRLLMRVPALGKNLETIALSRIAWTMSLTFNSSMDARRAIQLSLASAGNARFTDQTKQIEGDIMAGHPIHKALRNTGVFPVEFLDAIAVGEESGRLAESMERLAENYRERATSAFGVLTVIAGFLVWAMVAAVIIFLIFRLAGFYFGMINDAATQAALRSAPFLPPTVPATSAPMLLTTTVPSLHRLRSRSPACRR